MSAELADKLVLDDAVLEARLASLPRPLIFTNGVFDILHRGHVAYLHAARALGGALVLGLNSDRSARLLGKGPDRPLNAEIDRALVLAALESVSLVTFFDDKTPVRLLARVRPDIYVKGGDYDMEMLEETTLTRSWGGSAVAIPFVEGYSTTSLVRRIRTSSVAATAPAAFLDRDGVINVDHAYVHRWEDFEFVPGAIDAIGRLAGHGYRIVIVTNQSGIARGYYSEEQYQALTSRMLEEFAKRGIPITGVYHCPHHPDGSVAALARECDCRKPKPGMLLCAAADHGLSLPDSVLVGDRRTDIEAARAAGVGRAYLVRSGAQHDEGEASVADGCYQDLASCVDALLGTLGGIAACRDSQP